MTTNELTRCILRIATAILILAVAICLIRPNPDKRSPEGSINRTDTLTIRDTIIVFKPVVKTIRTIDTIYIAKSHIDTVLRSDTVFIGLPREQRHYEESNYSAWVSGYNPQLDSLQIYPEQPNHNNNHYTPKTEAKTFRDSHPNRLRLHNQRQPTPTITIHRSRSQLEYYQLLKTEQDSAK